MIDFDFRNVQGRYKTIGPGRTVIFLGAECSGSCGELSGILKKLLCVKGHRIQPQWLDPREVYSRMDQAL